MNKKEILIGLIGLILGMLVEYIILLNNFNLGNTLTSISTFTYTIFTGFLVIIAYEANSTWKTQKKYEINAKYLNPIIDYLKIMASSLNSYKELAKAFQSDGNEGVRRAYGGGLYLFAMSFCKNQIRSNLGVYNRKYKENTKKAIPSYENISEILIQIDTSYIYFMSSHDAKLQINQSIDYKKQFDDYMSENFDEPKIDSKLSDLKAAIAYCEDELIKFL